MPTSDSLFTAAEEQKVEELSEKSEFHRREHRRLTFDLMPFRDWCGLGKPAGFFSAEELQAFHEWSIQAKQHFEEMQACQMQLKQYRDLKNVIDCARQEGYQKGYAQGVALGCLERNLPIATIAKITGLSEAEIGALRAKS